MYSTVTYSIGAIVLCYSKEKKKREKSCHEPDGVWDQERKEGKGLLVIHIDSWS